MNKPTVKHKIIYCITIPC